VAASLCASALLLLVAAAPAGARPAATPIPVVAVTIGGADDHTIMLSKGLIGLTATTFAVRNTGKKPHSFEVCYNTTYSTTATSCIAGKTTKVLKHGQRASFTVTLQQGIHEFLSTVKGDAKRGMKGGVDAEPVAVPAPVDNSVAAPCANPVSTAIAVEEVDGSITLTPNTAPCGTVTFTVTNDSQISEHNFSIIKFGSTRAIGDTIEPGGNTATLAVVLGPGVHAYQSDNPVDQYQGMTGKFVVTG
jgi:hypothetical protein